MMLVRSLQPTKGQVREGEFSGKSLSSPAATTHMDQVFIPMLRFLEMRINPNNRENRTPDKYHCEKPQSLFPIYSGVMKSLRPLP